MSSYGEMVTGALVWATSNAVKSELAGALALGVLGAGYGYWKGEDSDDKVKTAKRNGLIGAGLGVLAGLAVSTYNKSDVYLLGFAAVAALAFDYYMGVTRPKTVQEKDESAQTEKNKLVINWAGISIYTGFAAFAATAAYSAVEYARG